MYMYVDMNLGMYININVYVCTYGVSNASAAGPIIRPKV
jgi:hypothetical protein